MLSEFTKLNLEDIDLQLIRSRIVDSTCTDRSGYSL